MPTEGSGTLESRRKPVSEDTPKKTYRAGSNLQDYCRPCKLNRMHTVLVASPSGDPVRVVCDFCTSQHNYRGNRTPTAPRPEGRSNRDPIHLSHDPLPLVSDRERSMPLMSQDNTDDLELLIRRVIREETGLTPTSPAEKWRGGELVLRPGRDGVQEKTWPIESFFHKVVMVRNRLRTLEQQINTSDLPEDTKLKIQGYITGCYGSLTSFNVLFADEDDKFTTKEN
jgi:hypothetical protein